MPITSDSKTTVTFGNKDITIFADLKKYSPPQGTIELTPSYSDQIVRHWHKPQVTLVFNDIESLDIFVDQLEQLRSLMENPQRAQATP